MIPQNRLPNLRAYRTAFEKPAQTPFTGLVTNKLLSALANTEFIELLPYLEPTSFRTGEYVFELGQEMSHLYFPETLVSSQLYYLDDGSSTGVSVVGNEGVLGMSAILGSKHASFWTMATVGGTALRIRTQDLRQEFVKGGSLHNLVLSHANERINQLAQRGVCNSRHRLEERLCTWLLMIYDRATDPDLPLTHEAISQQLGTRRAGITNLCNVLRDNGIISYHRGKITIVNPAELERSSCECYRRIKSTDWVGNSAVAHDSNAGSTIAR
jgi:CRP-like cAMP-binding protein